MARCSSLLVSLIVAAGACAPPEAHHTPIEGPVPVGQRVLVGAAFEHVSGAGMLYYLTALGGSPDLNEACVPERCYDAPYRFGIVAE